MNTQKNNSLGPFIVLTFIYFIVGFLTTVNGQFQGPLKIAFLSHTDELRNTLTTFISFFFFLGYLLNSSLGGKWINVHGYKKTLLRALSIMVIGLLMYSLSSWLVAVSYTHLIPIRNSLLTLRSSNGFISPNTIPFRRSSRSLYNRTIA